MTLKIFRIPLRFRMDQEPLGYLGSTIETPSNLGPHRGSQIPGVSPTPT